MDMCKLKELNCNIFHLYIVDMKNLLNQNRYYQGMVHIVIDLTVVDQEDSMNIVRSMGYRFGWLDKRDRLDWQGQNIVVENIGYNLFH
jgi:hypothetical protein